MEKKLRNLENKPQRSRERGWIAEIWNRARGDSLINGNRGFPPLNVRRQRSGAWNVRGATFVHIRPAWSARIDCQPSRRFGQVSGAIGELRERSARSPLYLHFPAALLVDLLGPSRFLALSPATFLASPSLSLSLVFKFFSSWQIGASRLSIAL